MSDLVLMVGPQGSGKTTYCDKNLKGYVRVSQDDQGKDHLRLFEEAVARGDNVVVDRINHNRQQRRRYLSPAKKAGYHTKIVWLNENCDVCRERIASRGKHPTLRPENAGKALGMYFSQFQAPSRREADELTVEGEAPCSVLVKDVRDEIGGRRYIIVGDIHGCYDEFQQGLVELGFRPEQDVLVSVGDVIDRGPDPLGVVRHLMSLNLHMVLGNHEDKFLRWAKGNPVKLAHGLQATIDSFQQDEDGEQVKDEFVSFLKGCPLILRVPHGYVVHAGFDPTRDPDEQFRSDCLYMRYYGGDSYFDAQTGILWNRLWPSDAPRVFFGHNPDPAGPCYNNIAHLDGGCVFGGYLKFWDSATQRPHYVQAKRAYATNSFPGCKENPHEHVARREAYMEAGLLRGDRTDDDRLAIYTYTDQCVFDRAWDDVTLNCRGHIYDLETGECVAWAFPKFFNLGEREETLRENLPWDKPYEVYEKLDGWLGVLYRHQGEYKVASRGSFHSPGSQWATQYISRKNLSALPDEATLVFEIINHDQKIILDYDETGLYVLAAFNRHTGEEYPRDLVEEWARLADLHVVRRYDSLSLEDCLEVASKAKHFEGYVIRFQDGRRVKVKTDWYKDMSKVMMGLSPILMWEAMSDGKVSESRMAEIPEEMRELAEQYKDKIESQYDEAKSRILAMANDFLAKHYDKGDSQAKKKLGIAQKDAPAVLRGVIWHMINGKSHRIDKAIMKVIYPLANQWVDVDQEIDN